MDHLEQARVELDRADEHATETVQLQVQNLWEGLFEEDEGDRTQTDPDAKIDRVVEVKKNLDALEDEADDRRVSDRLQNARDHLDTYLMNHPKPENPGDR